MRSPESAISSRRNLFDHLRLASAATVIFSHSFSLTGRREPVQSAIGFELGTIGVMVLFSLSGYLLASGWEQPQTGRDYWIKRGLRLMPGLVVSSLITALILGPVVTSLGAWRYLTDSGPYAYVAKHVVFDTFSSRLPGVFTHNPYPLTVNGSLWTIPVEVCCYFALYAGARVGALKRSGVLLALLFAVCVAMLIGHPSDTPNGLTHGTTDELLGALRPCGAFLAGAILWKLRDGVPRSLPLVLLAAIVALVPVPMGLHSALLITAVPYVVVVVGSLPPGRLAFITRRGDVTFGAYVYAYPLQQTLAGTISGLSPLGMMAFSFPLAWMLGFASWTLVERPALSLRRKLGRVGAGPPAAGPGIAPAIQ